MDRKGRIAYLPQYSFLPKGIKIKNLISFSVLKKMRISFLNQILIKPFEYNFKPFRRREKNC
jgi:hypothetical protein